MRDAQVLQLINAAVGRMANNANDVMVRMGQEIEEMRGYLTDETIRREILEEMLMEKSKLTGGLDKKEYGSRYDKKAAEHQERVKQAMAEQKAEAKKESESSSGIQVVGKKLVAADGVTPL